MMKDEDFKLLKSFDYGWTEKQTDICEYRVTFATKKNIHNQF